jgi:hypothetical protein
MTTDSRKVMGAHDSWLSPQDMADRMRMRLARRAFAVRIAAAGCALVATVLTVGMQIGIVAVYSGDLDATVAAIKAQPRASRVASACNPTPGGGGGKADAQRGNAGDAPHPRRPTAIPCQ